MRTCCAALGTRLSALWWPKWERNPKKRDICIRITDSLCCTAETNSIVKQRCCFIRNYPTIVQSNCAILPHILISTLLFFYIFWPCGMWGLSFLPRDWTCTPALGTWSLSTWSTKKVPFLLLLGWIIFHCVCYHILFIRSPVDGHLVCFHKWVMLLWVMLFWTQVYNMCARPCFQLFWA